MTERFAHRARPIEGTVVATQAGSDGEFTLSGLSPITVGTPAERNRLNQRLLLAYFALGLPATVATVILAVAWWQSPAEWTAVIVLSTLALLAQFFPVQVSYTNVSLGMGFILATCLLAGPSVGAVVVALVFLIWTSSRGFLPWFQSNQNLPPLLRFGRVVYSTGVSGLTYFVATAGAFAVFDQRYPVRSVTLDSLGASIVLAVSAYLLQNVFSLVVSLISGHNVSKHLRTVIPVPALAEFLSLPAALLLVSVETMGVGPFALLACLYLMAAFLGWRSWQDRENIKRRLEDVELLNRAGAALSGTLEIGELIRRLHGVLHELAVFDSLVLVVDDPCESLRQCYIFDNEGRRGSLDDAQLADTQRRPEGLSDQPSGDSVLIRDMPLSEGAIVRLRLDFGPQQQPSPNRVVLIDTICQQAGTALSNARLYRLANTDPLTGVAIRRYFERALRSTAARGEDFAVIMLDLDRFKQVNDTHGHRAGDAVLRDLAGVLVGTLRVTDVVARYGGEEFVILLPGASAPEGAAVAERTRRILDQRQLRMDEAIVRYTASFGVAASTDLEEIADPMQAVWKADAALLEAKRAGRNQVITYSALTTHRR